MPLINFPQIPNVPGVPALSRAVEGLPQLAAGALISKVKSSLLRGMLASALQNNFDWGIFDSEGKALADPAEITGLFGAALDSLGLGSLMSTVAVDYSKETRVADFPLEDGWIASYNKVVMPGMATVVLALSGKESARIKFLESIHSATESTETYDIITPTAKYINYTIEKYNYQRRNDRGAGLLIVELTLREIRQVEAQYSGNEETGEDGEATGEDGASDQIKSPADAGATPTADAGVVQPKNPVQSVLKSVVNKISGVASQIQNVKNTAQNALNNVQKAAQDGANNVANSITQ